MVTSTGIGPEHADTFRRDLKADYLLANPRAGLISGPL